jgi:meiotically up-regulated gene 157 (Mug157) protein
MKTLILTLLLLSQSAAADNLKRIESQLREANTLQTIQNEILFRKLENDSLCPQLKSDMTYWKNCEYPSGLSESKELETLELCEKNLNEATEDYNNNCK